jgi:hypothetical protein
LVPVAGNRLRCYGAQEGEQSVGRGGICRQLAPVDIWNPLHTLQEFLGLLHRAHRRNWFQAIIFLKREITFS